MEFSSTPMVDQSATNCLQVTLTCSQDEVHMITGLGRICASLLPCDTHPNFTGLTFHDIVNKRLIVKIPPEHSDKAIESRIRWECQQLQDELKYLYKTSREKRYAIGHKRPPQLTRRAYYGS